MRKSVAWALVVAVLLLGSRVLAKPGVVTDLQGKTFGGDVTEDSTYVYIDGPSGKMTLDKRNVASIDYVPAPQNTGPATAPPALDAGPAASADPGKTPEKIFADKGLIKSGFMLILPQEQALHDAVKQLRIAKGKVAVAVAKIRDADNQLKTMGDDLKAIDTEAHDIDVQIAKGNKSNQLVARYHLLLDEYAQLLAKIYAAEEARDKLLAPRSDYITAALDAADKADAAIHAYDGPKADRELAVAIDQYNLTARPKVKLGPSGSFDDDLKFVEQCRADVTSRTVPITLEGGVPNVDVLINGQVTERMIWDSGAANINLSAKTAKALGLHLTDKDPIVEISIADGSHVKEHLITVDSIRIGAFTVENVPCIVPPPGVEGSDLLGDEFQKHFEFKLDVNNQSLQLSPLDAVAVEPRKPVQIAPNGKRLVDLLAGFSVQDQAVSGTWHQSVEAITSDLGDYSRVDFNYRPPKEYDYKVTFTKLEGDDALMMILCVNGRQFSWMMGGWTNTVCGFEEICGKRANENPTTVKNLRLESGKTYTAIVKVRSNDVSAYMDNQLIAQWQTDYRDMGRREMPLHRTDTLGICTWKTSYAVSQAQVVEIGGSGATVTAADPVKAKRLGTVSYEQPNRNTIVTLYDNGHFNAPGDDDHRWFLRGNTLFFRWGRNLDSFTLSADQRTFDGYGVHKEPIHGEFLTGSLIGEPNASATNSLPPALLRGLDHSPPGGLVLYLPFAKADADGNLVHDRSTAHLTLPSHGIAIHADPANPSHGIADFDPTAWIDGKSFTDFPTRAFTLAAWFKAIPQHQGPIIDDTDWNGGGTHRGAAIRLEDSYPQFVLGADDWITLRASSRIIPDKWYHLAGTFDGTVLRLYLNGQEEQSGRLHGKFNPGIYPLNIGRNPFDTNRLFNGTLAEVMVFSRALSADEVAKLAGANK